MQQGNVVGLLPELFQSDCPWLVENKLQVGTTYLMHCVLCLWYLFKLRATKTTTGTTTTTNKQTGIFSEDSSWRLFRTSTPDSRILIKGFLSVFYLLFSISEVIFLDPGGGRTVLLVWSLHFAYLKRNGPKQLWEKPYMVAHYSFKTLYTYIKKRVIAATDVYFDTRSANHACDR